MYKRQPIGWAATGLLILLVLVALIAKIPLPGLKASLITLLVITVLLALIIIVVGPNEVFKAMHEFVFPPENQWFFYYQDSLMTTLMKAPDIFFAIGAAWALLAVIIYLLITLTLRVIDRSSAPSGS